MLLGGSLVVPSSSAVLDNLWKNASTTFSPAVVRLLRFGTASLLATRAFRNDRGRVWSNPKRAERSPRLMARIRRLQLARATRSDSEEAGNVVARASPREEFAKWRAELSAEDQRALVIDRGGAAPADLRRRNAPACKWRGHAAPSFRHFWAERPPLRRRAPGGGPEAPRPAEFLDFQAQTYREEWPGHRGISLDSREPRAELRLVTLALRAPPGGVDGAQEGVVRPWDLKGRLA